MKKRMVAALCFATMLSCAFCFSSCGYSETFEGTLSAKSYSTADEALNAFLKNEIDGDTTSCVFTEYEKSADLTAEQVAALPLGDLKAEDVESAETGTITYSTAASGAAVSPLAVTTLSADPSLKQHEVTLLKTGGSYRYFVPATSNGEMITKSYYDDVFDVSKYANCTMTYKMTEKITFSGSGTEQLPFNNVDIDMKITMKLTESAVYFSFAMKGGEALSEDAEDNLNGEFYCVERDGKVVVYGKNDAGEWSSEYSHAFGSFSSLSELVTIQDTTGLDHTYFEKTNKGFKLTEEKYAELIKNVLGFSLGEKVSAEATYFVSEGRLSKMTMKMSFAVSESGISVSASASAEAVYKNFGSTKVELPADLTAVLPEA